MNDPQKLKNILAKNLSYYIERSGENQTEIAQKLGVPEMTMSNWVKAKTYPRMDKVQLLADYFNIRRSDLTEEKPANLIEVSQRTARIPVLGEIACGDPILAEENFNDYRTVIEEHLPPGDLVYLLAKGDSMKPTVPNGSWVLIRIQEEVENGEIAAVTFNGNTEVTLKRVKKQGKNIVLMPDNNDFEPIFITKDNPVRIIGKAIRSEQEL